MKDVHIDRDVGSKLLVYGALFALLGAIAYSFVPKSSEGAMAKRKLDEVSSLEARKAATADKAAKLQASIKARTWQTSLQETGPAALGIVTKIARSHRLRLTTFRPQKPVTTEGLTQVPIVTSVEGPFPDVMAFLHDLEKPERNLALGLLQLAAADGATDRTVATIGLTAFVASHNPGVNDGKAL